MTNCYLKSRQFIARMLLNSSISYLFMNCDQYLLFPFKWEYMYNVGMTFPMPNHKNILLNVCTWPIHEILVCENFCRMIVCWWARWYCCSRKYCILELNSQVNSMGTSTEVVWIETSGLCYYHSLAEEHQFSGKCPCTPYFWSSFLYIGSKFAWMSAHPGASFEWLIGAHLWSVEKQHRSLMGCTL